MGESIINRVIGTDDTELIELHNSFLYLVIQRHMQLVTMATLVNSLVQITNCNFKQVRIVGYEIA